MDATRTDRTWSDGLVMAIVSAVVYACTRDYFLFGDSAMYADYVAQGKFDELTLHIGYYWAIWAAQALFGAPLGLPLHQTIVWFDVVAGAATVLVAHRLAVALLDDRRLALVTAIVLAVSGRIVSNATTSEIYMLQALVVLGAFLAYVRARPVVAGLLAAAGLLVTPLSAFGYLFFPAYGLLYRRRVEWRALGLMAAAGTLVYGPYLLVHGHELFFGLRGLLVIRDATPVSPLRTIGNLPKYQFEAYTAMLLLGVAAIAAIRKHRAFLFLSLAVAVPHAYIVTKLTGEDNVFLILTDFFFAALLAIGWDALRTRVGPVVATAPIALHVAVYIVSGGLLTFDPNTRHAREAAAVVRDRIEREGAPVLAEWGTKMALVYLGRARPDTVLRHEPLAARIYDVHGGDQSDPRLLEAPTLYLYDTWHAGPMSRLLRSANSRRAQEEQNSARGIAERTLGVRCTLLEEGYGRLYRCARRGSGA